MPSATEHKYIENDSSKYINLITEEVLKTKFQEETLGREIEKKVGGG
jgi:hypothetical protein